MTSFDHCVNSNMATITLPSGVPEGLAKIVAQLAVASLSASGKADTVCATSECSSTASTLCTSAKTRSSILYTCISRFCVETGCIVDYCLRPNALRCCCHCQTWYVGFCVDNVGDDAALVARCVPLTVAGDNTDAYPSDKEFLKVCVVCVYTPMVHCTSQSHPNRIPTTASSGQVAQGSHHHRDPHNRCRHPQHHPGIH